LDNPGGAHEDEDSAYRSAVPSGRGILRALKLITGHGNLGFAGCHDRKKPTSNNTILYALDSLGYRDRILNEHEFDEAHIEFMLAHTKRNEVAAAYNHAKYLMQRTEMMQWGADHLDAQFAKGRRALAA